MLGSSFSVDTAYRGNQIIVMKRNAAGNPYQYRLTEAEETGKTAVSAERASGHLTGKDRPLFTSYSQRQKRTAENAARSAAGISQQAAT